MNVNVRSRHGAAAILVVLCLVPCLSGRALMSQIAQTAPAPDLDRALRANDLDKARALIPADWTAAEQLFVSYLDRAYTTPAPKTGQPDARALAGRLAEVFVRIIEFDFEKALLSALDSAEPARRQQLIEASRDFFTARQQLRAEFGAGSTVGPTTPERTRTRAEFLEIADRFHVLSFLCGELHTLKSMVNLPDGQSSQARANQVAQSLGDARSLLKRPYTEASLEIARSLGLVKTQAGILEETNAALERSKDVNQLEQAARHLEEARALLRQIPTLETVNNQIFSAEAPRVAGTTLPRLWAVYEQLQRPEAARDLLAEALEISRAFGEAAQRATVRSFASQAVSHNVSSDETQPIFQAALKVSLRAGFEVVHSLAFSSASELRPDAVGKAKFLLGLYETVIPLCLASGDAGLAIDALADQAALQASSDGAVAAATFRDAINRAVRAGDFTRAAQVANRALTAFSGRNASTYLEFANRAIDAAKKADDPLDLARAYRSRADLPIGANHESLQDAQRAVAAAERYTTASGDFTEERMCLTILAEQHQLRGEYQDEIVVLERAAAKERTFRSPTGSTIAEVGLYEKITNVYSNYLGEPGLALAASKRASQLLEPRTVSTLQAVGVTDWARIGDAHYRLGYLYWALRQPVFALDAWTKALAEFKSAAAVPANQTSQRSVLTNRAHYLTELGDYEAAQRDLDDILPLMAATQRSFRGGSHLQKATWLADAADIQTLAGNAEKALALAREAVAELRQETSDVWFYGNYVATVVDALLKTGHPDEAFDFCNSIYKKARERAVVDQPVLEKGFLETMARIDVKAARFDDARVRLLAAGDIDRKNPTAEIGGLASSALALGNLEISAGNYEKGRQVLLAARDAVDAHDLNRIWQIERALGLVLSKLGDAAGAESHYDKALTALESAPEHLRPEEFELSYGLSRWQIYAENAGLLAAKAARSGLAADTEHAFQATERKRTQMLWSLLATGWSRVSPDAMPEQIKRAFDLEARIAAKQALLRTQSDLAPEKRDAALVETLRIDLTQVQAEHARLLTSIAQGQYRYAAPTALAASLAAPVRAALGPSRVLVEYLVMDDRSYAFVVSASGVKAVPLAVGRKALREQVTHLLQPFQQLRSGEVDLTRLSYDTHAAYKLYQAIFEPVRAALGSATEVLIVPDDVLSVLPFEALIDRAPRNIAPGAVLHGELSGESFLIRRFTIGYLTSSAQLLSNRGAEPPAQSKQLFAMANPTGGRVTPAPVQDDPLKRQLRSGRFDTFFAPLPGSEVEVSRIAQYFKGSATIITGAKATKAAYTSQAGQYGIIHFATHALASDGQPLYSTLVLAPDGDDGFLQAYEVLRTPLRANLVVLSGCETALGAEDWGQGLLGLVAAFEQAGAKSVLATLWSIDESSADMMGAFYRSMAQGNSTPAALRQAKLQLLQQHVQMGGVEVSLAHPFFWAPFILVGDPSIRQAPIGK